MTRALWWKNARLLGNLVLVVLDELDDAPKGIPSRKLFGLG